MHKNLLENVAKSNFEINITQVDDAKNLDAAMPMCNLVKYNGNIQNDQEVFCNITKMFQTIH